MSFIPLFKFESENFKDIEHTLFINKNTIVGFSHFKIEENECLLVKFDFNKFSGTSFPREYAICKENNPIAFNELFKNLPSKLPKIENKY